MQQTDKSSKKLSKENLHQIKVKTSEFSPACRPWPLTALTQVVERQRGCWVSNQEGERVRDKVLMR